MNDFRDYCEIIYENLESIRKKSEQLLESNDDNKEPYNILLSGLDKGFYLLERCCLREVSSIDLKKAIHEVSNVYSVIRGAIFILKIKNREDKWICAEIEKIDESIENMWSIIKENESKKQII